MDFTKYELSLWTHDDTFISLLKGSEKFNGEAYDVKFKKNVSEIKELTFSIPLVIYDNEINSFVENELWNLLINESKIRLIFNKKTENEEIHDFILKTFNQIRDGEIKTAEIQCISYVFYELGRVGYEVNFSEENLEEKDENGEPTGFIFNGNLNFWMNQLLPYTNNEYDYLTNQSGWQYLDSPFYEKEIITGYALEWDDIANQNIYKPIYSEDQVEKSRSIKIEKSNVFNIIQDLAEKFQVWPKFEYEYDKFNYKTVARKIFFTEENISDSLYSFTYGLNLNNINKEIDSNDLVTKMYVEKIDSEFEDDTYLNIGDAEQNPTLEEYIYNFDYFRTAGIIDDNKYAEFLIHQSNLRAKNMEILPIEVDIITLEEELNILIAKRDFVQFQLTGSQTTYDNLVKELSLYSNTVNTTQNYFATINKINDIKYIVDLSHKIGIVPGSFRNFKNHNKIAINPTYTYLYDEEDTSLITGLIFTSNPDLDTTYRIYFDFDSNIYKYTEKLMLSEKSKIISFSSQYELLNNEVNEINISLETKRSSFKTKKEEKKNLISTFEKSYKDYIKEGSWVANDYPIKSRSINVTETNSIPILYTNEFTYAYYTNIDLNNIDFTSIQIWKYSNNNFIFPYSRYSDYNLEYGFVNSNRCLLFTPVENGAFFVNALSDGIYSTVIAENPTLYLKYKTKDLGVYKTATISYSSGNKSSRYFTLTDKNILKTSIQIKPLANLNSLIENVDYTISKRYIGINLVTDIYLKPTDNALHLSEYEEVIIQVNNTSEFFYYDAKDVLNRSSQPAVSYSINVVDLSHLDGFESFKPQTGQKILITDYELKIINTYGFISEILYNLDYPLETSITVSNFKTKFEDIFQKIVATTQSMQSKEVTFELLSSAILPNRTISADILQNSLTENFIELNTGNQNSVTWGNDGITLTDASNDYPIPAMVKIIGNGIYLSYRNGSNGQREWQTAITARGINASQILTGQLDTKKITIWNSNQPRFVWTSEGLFALGHDYLGNTDFNTFVRYNDEGLLFQRLMDAGTENEKAISELSLTWDGLTIGLQDDSIKLTSTYGLQVFDSSQHERVQLGRLIGTDTYGLRLTDGSQIVTLETDSDGKLWLRDSLTIGSSTDNSVGLTAEGILPSSVRIWAGGDRTQLWNSLLGPKFIVTQDGKLYAADATVSGSINATSGSFIGAITIGSGTMKIGQDVNGSNDGLYVGTSGDYIYDTGAFRFGGTNGITYTGSGNVTIGTNVSILGSISAQAGLIAGWEVTPNELYKGTGSNKISLDSYNSKIYVGLGTYNNTNTSFYVDSLGNFSLKDKLYFDGNSLTIVGTLNGSTIIGSLFKTSSTTGNGQLNGNGIIIDSNSTRYYASSILEPVTVISALTGEITSKNGVFTGSIFQTQSDVGTGSPDSISGVIFDSNGIRGYSGVGTSPSFNLSATNGVLTANSAVISGTINATNGNFTSIITIGNGSTQGALQVGTVTPIYIVGTNVNTTTRISTGGASAYNTNGIWLDASGRLSLKSSTNSLLWNGTSLTVNGAINATSGTFNNTITVGTGTTTIKIDGTSTTTTTAIHSSNATTYDMNGIWLDASGRFSLKSATNSLLWNGSTLSIVGSISSSTITGGTITGGTFKTSSTTGDGGSNSSGVIIDSTSARFYGPSSSTASTVISTTTGQLLATGVNLTGSIQSNNYSSGVSGWRIDGSGNAEFENITARGALKSTAFIYDEINAQGGSLIITPSGVLNSDTLKSNAATTLSFNIKNTYLNQPYIFEVDDTVLVKTFINTTTQIILWLKITIRGDRSGAYTNYTASILSSTPTTEYTIPGGTPIVRYGKDTTGFILLKSDDLTNSPYIDIIVNEGLSIHNSSTQKTKVRLGKLNGITDSELGTLSGYGLYAQNAFLTGTISLPTAGITNYTSVNNDVRIWAGKTYSNRETSNFRVYENGRLVLGNGISDQMIFDPIENKITFGSNVDIGFTGGYDIIISGSPINYGDLSTTLSVKIFDGGIEITDDITDPTKLQWYINDVLKGTGKTMVFTSTDIIRTANISCVYTP